MVREALCTCSLKRRPEPSPGALGLSATVTPTLPNGWPVPAHGSPHPASLFPLSASLLSDVLARLSQGEGSRRFVALMPLCRPGRTQHRTAQMRRSLTRPSRRPHKKRNYVEGSPRYTEAAPRTGQDRISSGQRPPGPPGQGDRTTRIPAWNGEPPPTIRPGIRPRDPTSGKAPHLGRALRGLLPRDRASLRGHSPQGPLFRRAAARRPGVCPRRTSCGIRP